MGVFDDFSTGDGVEILSKIKNKKRAYFSGFYRGFVRDTKGKWSIILDCKLAPNMKLCEVHVPTNAIKFYRHHPKERRVDS